MMRSRRMDSVKYVVEEETDGNSDLSNASKQSRVQVQLVAHNDLLLYAYTFACGLCNV